MQVNQSQSQNDLAPTDSDQTHCKNVRIILSLSFTLDFFKFTKETI